MAPFSPSGNYQMYLQEGGEMGKLTRQYDWASSPLGSPDTWSQSLLTTVSILLRSKFPMFLWWGPQLIQFYNDAYRPSLGAGGKHPKALGQSGEKCWPEIWPVINPLIDQVMAGGEATWSDNQLIPIYRNNRIEDVYWTFSYSPVIDETGEPGGVLVICTETTDNIRTYNAISDAKKELEFAIEAGGLATWDYNPRTKKIVGNARTFQWLDAEDKAEIELAKAISVMAAEDKERVAEAISKALARGSDGNYNIEHTIIDPKTSGRRTVKSIGQAVFDAEGDAIRFSGTMQDITEEYNFQVRKDEFISVASHELKTPITSLNASMQILQKLIKNEDINDKIRLFFGKASNNLAKLVHLLDDLLNVTKIQQGQLVLNKTRFNLGELVRDSCEQLSLNDDHEVNITGDRELMVYADYRRIDQVLVNLVNNAIKYSPQTKQVDIIIEQYDGLAKVHVSGLGLGLYISSEIIKRHDGEITAVSERGNGSCFTFTLPLD
ncbi:hypothetical protein A0256_18885 [Mucilaginibacter sp. PAMC 26640]|nr:hypothetical protein A0256_18885 [Mucilaginibacter sp. PAMC 26640]